MSGSCNENDIRLWQSVILQALLDCGNLSRTVNPSWPDWKHRQITEEARQWFRDDDSDFEDVCALANLDSRLIRKFAMRVARGDSKAKRALIEWRDWFRRKERKGDKTCQDQKQI
jgi:hypothetical protein|tara:strand:+ start:606 stop:950 length:345 start_codon:yes stop_codon:yes gene_type:complete